MCKDRLFCLCSGCGCKIYQGERHYHLKYKDGRTDLCSAYCEQCANSDEYGLGGKMVLVGQKDCEHSWMNAVDEEGFEEMSLEEISDSMTELYGKDVSVALNGNRLVISVELSDEDTFTIELERDDSSCNTWLSSWFANFITDESVYLNRFSLNADDERAYVCELAMKYASNNNWFNEVCKDDRVGLRPTKSR